jgi:uncharacterized membrane protein
MSLRAIPVTVIPFILYFLLATTGVDFSGALTGGDGWKMMSGGTWKLTWGDVILVITMICLFIEILKATYTSTASLVDHGLSMVLFIIALIAFLMVPQAATSAFFLLLVALVIDVIAGFTIGIRVAKRDIGFGGGDQ